MTERVPIILDKQFECPYENVYGYIYMTTCLINNKKYIGQHYFPHLHIDNQYFGSGKMLKRALKKWGKENFAVIILEWCVSAEELNQKELYYLELFHAVTSKDFYNMWYDCCGFLSGEKHPFFGRTGKDAIAYGNEYFKGKHHTEHAKQLQRNAARTPERMKQNLSNIKKAIEANTGRPLSEEHKKHISETHKSRGVNKGEDNPMFGKSLGMHPRAKKVGQYTKDGEFIREFSCIKETSLYGFCACAVRDCCSGRQKTSGGYVWKFLT